MLAGPSPIRVRYISTPMPRAITTSAPAGQTTSPTGPSIRRRESRPAHHESVDRGATLRGITAGRTLPASRVQL